MKLGHGLGILPVGFGRYLLVGGTTFVIYFGQVAALFSGLHVPYAVAVAIAYVIAMAFHFLANRTYTFHVGEGRVKTQLGRYVALVVFNCLLQLLVIYLIHDVCGQNFYVAALLGITITLVAGFVLMRFWVFMPGGDASPGRATAPANGRAVTGAR